MNVEIGSSFELLSAKEWNDYLSVNIFDKMLIDIDSPTREFLQTIIEKIIIDKDKNIEIIYKFSILNSL